MIAGLLPSKSRSILDSVPLLDILSSGGSTESRIIESRLRQMRQLLSEPVANLHKVLDTAAAGATTAETLQLKLTLLKKMTSNVAMHLDGAWRISLFATLDQLLDPEDWHEGKYPSEQSFSTFLRMIIYLHPTRRPGVGLAPSGNFLASWRRGDDRIVIECLANDEVRWVLSRVFEGDRESGAGKVQIHRIPEVVAPYEPESLFTDGDKLLV